MLQSHAEGRKSHEIRCTKTSRVLNGQKENYSKENYNVLDSIFRGNLHIPSLSYLLICSHM